MKLFLYSSFCSFLSLRFNTMNTWNVLRCLQLAFFLLHVKSSDSVQLGPRAANYVSQLVNEFRANSTGSQFDQVICPPRRGEDPVNFFYPKIFIWCPIDHYGLKINCPLHGSPLTPGFFTYEVDKKKSKESSLSLRFTWKPVTHSGNVYLPLQRIDTSVLVSQRANTCKHSSDPQTEFFSSSVVVQIGMYKTISRFGRDANTPRRKFP